VEQLVASAEAAVEEVVKRGVSLCSYSFTQICLQNEFFAMAATFMSVFYGALCKVHS